MNKRQSSVRRFAASPSRQDEVSSTGDNRGSNNTVASLEQQQQPLTVAKRRSSRGLSVTKLSTNVFEDAVPVESSSSSRRNTNTQTSSSSRFARSRTSPSTPQPQNSEFRTDHDILPGQREEKQLYEAEAPAVLNTNIRDHQHRKRRGSGVDRDGATKTQRFGDGDDPSAKLRANRRRSSRGRNNQTRSSLPTFLSDFGRRNFSVSVRVIVSILFIALQLFFFRVFLQTYELYHKHERRVHSSKPTIEKLIFSIDDRRKLKESDPWWQDPETITALAGSYDAKKGVILVIASEVVSAKHLAALWSHLECATRGLDNQRTRVFLALPDWSRHVVEPLIQRFSNPAMSHQHLADEHPPLVPEPLYLIHDRRHIGLWCQALEWIDHLIHTDSTIVLMRDNVFSLRPKIILDLVENLQSRQSSASSWSSSAESVDMIAMIGSRRRRNVVTRNEEGKSVLGTASTTVAEDSLRAFTAKGIRIFQEHSCSIPSTHTSFGLGHVSSKTSSNYIKSGAVQLSYYTPRMDAILHSYHDVNLTSDTFPRYLTSAMALFSTFPSPTKQLLPKNRKAEASSLKMDLQHPWHSSLNFEYWKTLVQPSTTKLPLFPFAKTNQPRMVHLEPPLPTWMKWCLKGLWIDDSMTNATDDGEMQDNALDILEEWMGWKPYVLRLDKYFQPIITPD